MALFLFKCRLCPTRSETTNREADIECSNGHTPSPMVRNWRGESVGVSVGNLRNERNEGKDGLKRMFLPHNDDFKGPGDPDGTRGMAEWRETHQPRPSNHNPDWPGEVPKRVF